MRHCAARGLPARAWIAEPPPKRRKRSLRPGVAAYPSRSGSITSGRVPLGNACAPRPVDGWGSCTAQRGLLRVISVGNGRLEPFELVVGTSARRGRASTTIRGREARPVEQPWTRRTCQLRRRRRLRRRFFDDIWYDGNLGATEEFLQADFLSVTTPRGDPHRGLGARCERCASRALVSIPRAWSRRQGTATAHSRAWGCAAARIERWSKPRQRRMVDERVSRVRDLPDARLELLLERYADTPRGRSRAICPTRRAAARPSMRWQLRRGLLNPAFRTDARQALVANPNEACCAMSARRGPWPSAAQDAATAGVAAFSSSSSTPRVHRAPDGTDLVPRHTTPPSSRPIS